MGAGRYNQQSKNHGGEHTGIGKKQKKGKYFTNGIVFNKESHKKFTVDTKVVHKKSGLKGVVIEKEKNYPRSLIHVRFENGSSGYYYTNLLYRSTYSDNYLYNTLNKNKKVVKNKRNYNVEKFNKFKEKKENELIMKKKQRLENKQKREEFKQWKKELNEVVFSNVCIDYTSDTINGQFKYNTTDNEYINKHIVGLYNRCLQTDKNINSKLGSKERKLSKYHILNNATKSNCGSTNNITNAPSKMDHYNYVHEAYMNKN